MDTTLSSKNLSQDNLVKTESLIAYVTTVESAPLENKMQFFGMFLMLFGQIWTAFVVREPFCDLETQF